MGRRRPGHPDVPASPRPRPLALDRGAALRRRGPRGSAPGLAGGPVARAHARPRPGPRLARTDVAPRRADANEPRRAVQGAAPRRPRRARPAPNQRGSTSSVWSSPRPPPGRRARGTSSTSTTRTSPAPRGLGRTRSRRRSSRTGPPATRCPPAPPTPISPSSLLSPTRSRPGRGSATGLGRVHRRRREGVPEQQPAPGGTSPLTGPPRPPDRGADRGGRLRVGSAE